MRLIDADEFDVISYKETVGYADCFDSGALYALELIDAAPEIDAVEVVRCKDCKHYKPQKKTAHWENRANYCNRIVTIKVQPDDFCSYGERKGAKLDEEVSE